MDRLRAIRIDPQKLLRTKENIYRIAKFGETDERRD